MEIEKMLISMRDGRKYLPVAARVLWFRENHPEWTIETEAIVLDPDAGIAVFRARILDEDNRLIATGTKMETKSGFGDYIEKAETGAIGRALALAGFGTSFALEIADDDIVDAPAPAQAPAQAPAPEPAPAQHRPAFTCSQCGEAVSAAVAQYTLDKYGDVLCPKCQRRYRQR